MYFGKDGCFVKLGWWEWKHAVRVWLCWTGISNQIRAHLCVGSHIGIVVLNIDLK